MTDNVKFDFHIFSDKKQGTGSQQPFSASSSSGLTPQSAFSFGSINFSFDGFGSQSSQSKEAPTQQPFSFGNSAAAAAPGISAFQFSFSSTEQPSFSFGSSENQKSVTQNERSIKQRKAGATRRSQPRRGAGNGQFQFSRASVQTDSAASFDMLPLDTVFLACSWLEYDFTKHMTGCILLGKRFSSAAASLLFCRDADGHHRLLYPNLLVTDDSYGRNQLRLMLHCLPYRAAQRLVFRVSAKTINALDNMFTGSMINIWNQLCLANNQCLEVLSFANSENEKSDESAMLPRKNIAFSLPLSIDKLPPFANSLKHLSYFETEKLGLKHFVPALLPNLQHLTVYFAFYVASQNDDYDEVLASQTLTAIHELHGEDYKPFANLREFVVSGRFIPGLYEWISKYSSGLKRFTLSDRSCPGTTRASSRLLSSMSNYPGCFDSTLESLSIQCAIGPKAAMGDIKLPLERFSALRSVTLNLNHRTQALKGISHLTQLRELTLIEFSDRLLNNMKVLYADLAAALADSLRSLTLVHCSVDLDLLAGSVPSFIEHYTVVKPSYASSLCPRIAFGAKCLTIKDCHDRVGGLVGLFLGDFDYDDLDKHEIIPAMQAFKNFDLPRSKHLEIIDSTVLVDTLKKILAQRQVEVASVSIRNCSVKRLAKSEEVLVESLNVESIEDLFSSIVNGLK